MLILCKEKRPLRRIPSERFAASLFSRYVCAAEIAEAFRRVADLIAEFLRGPLFEDGQ